MSNTVTLIASGQSNAVTFSNIPQTYDDLMVLISMEDLSGGAGQTLYSVWNNDNSTLYSGTWIEGNGSSSYSSRNSAQTGFRLGVVNSNGSTNSNIFGNLFFYLPNYRTTNRFKSFICDYVTENGATLAYMGLDTGVYRSTNAITQLSYGTGFSLDSITTYYLYGIKKT